MFNLTRNENKDGGTQTGTKRGTYSAQYVVKI